MVMQGGVYEAIDSSHALQGLSVATINGVLQRRFDFGETALIRGFRHSIDCFMQLSFGDRFRRFYRHINLGRLRMTGGDIRKHPEDWSHG